MSLFHIVATISALIIGALAINHIFNPRCCSQQYAANRRWLIAVGTSLVVAFAATFGV